MPAPKRPSAAQLQKQCDTWNAANPEGTTVSYEEIRGQGETFRGKSICEAQVLSGHSAVIWLEGKRGCVMLSHCTAVPAPAVLRVTLEDRGQDFTDWYVREGVVIDCQPSQGRVWVGTKVTNVQELAPGVLVNIVSLATGEDTSLNYPVLAIETLSPEEATKVEGIGLGWAEMMCVAPAALGL